MAQYPTKLVKYPGAMIDHTPSGAVTAGDVVEVGNLPCVATQDIAASALGALATEGIFDVAKCTDVFTIGDAVYWNNSGNPVGGDASNGAADNTTGNLMGIALANATNNATVVRTKLTAAMQSHGGAPTFAAAIVSANGGNIATAAAVARGFTFVTNADNSKGVQLPSCANGVWCVITNQTTDKTLEIFPPTGKQINGAGANNAITLVANGSCLLWSEGTNAYYGGLMAGIMS